MQPIRGHRPPKVPPMFFSAEVRYTICVVEFRRGKKNKVRKKKSTDSGAQDLKSSAEKKKSADLRTSHAP